MIEKIKFPLFLIFLLATPVIAQTGIGTTTPHASAKLDVTATNKGFLPPRVTLTSSTDASTIASPATGLLVYNTGTNAGLRAGYYYWNGTDWTTIATPTSAETVDYVSVMLTTDQSNVAVGQNVKFQTIQAGNIPYDASTGNFTLTAGKTYRLSTLATLNGTSPAASAVDLTWRLADGTNIGPLASLMSANANISYSGQGVIDYIYTPTSNTTISLYVAFVGNSTSVLRANWTNATITQIGSSAIINPWVLSGNNVYNTTGKVGIGTTSPSANLQVNGTSIIGNGTANFQVGAWSGGGSYAAIANSNVFATPSSYALVQSNSGETYLNSASGQPLHLKVGNGSEAIIIGTNNNVGIGTSSPSSTLDVNGNVNVTGKINLTDPTGNVAVKAAGYVNAGSFVTLDNIKATVATSGNRGLCIATASGSIVAYMSGTYGATGGVGGGALNTTFTFNTTLSTSIFGWGFSNVGDSPVYLMNDTTNNRFYRITLMIGYGFNNNFISIERLL